MQKSFRSVYRILELLLVAGLSAFLVRLFELHTWVHPISKQPHTSTAQSMHLNLDNLDFSLIDNETGADLLIVPNIVHYIKFSDVKSVDLSFHEYLSILSAHQVQKPNIIYLHTDAEEIKGHYYDRLRENVSELTVLPITRSREIFGIKLNSSFATFHATDIARIQVLQRFGGIYIDSDVLILNPLDEFRKFETSLAWADNQYLGSQVLVAHRHSRFLSLWMDCYHDYQPTKWYYNAGELPTKRILYKTPQLVHRVKYKFGVHARFVQKLYMAEEWPNWQSEMYSVHLLRRHRSYMAKKDVERTGIKEFDENNIKFYDRPFGEMARRILYGTTDLLEEPHFPIKS